MTNRLRRRRRRGSETSRESQLEDRAGEMTEGIKTGPGGGKRGAGVHPVQCFTSGDGSEVREREREVGETAHTLTDCELSQSLLSSLSSPPPSALNFALRPNFHTICILKLLAFTEVTLVMH